YSGRDVHPPPPIDVIGRTSCAALSRRDEHRRIIQDRATRVDLVPQAWNSAPEQAHGAGNMRGGHRRATGCGISGVTGVTGRARAGARSSEVRLDPPAAVPGDRPAATEASNGVGAGNQRASRVRRVIKGRRIRHGGTSWPRVTRSYDHLDTSSSLSFNSGLQLVANCAAFRGWATPGVNRYVGCLGRVAISVRAVDRIRRKEKFHALHVCGWCAVALVHVTAPDPLRARGHTDLVTRAVIADRCAGGV